MRYASNHLSSIGRALKNGYKSEISDNVLKLLKPDGSELARFTNNIMEFNYSGFGGKILTQSNKTTTIIGKYNPGGPGTKSIIDSGLSKTGRNTGGLNVLDAQIPAHWTDQQIWDNVNSPWLREAAQNNDIIRVISDPLSPNNIFKPNGTLSFMGREHELLTKPVNLGGLGYTYNPSNFTYTR